MNFQKIKQRFIFTGAFLLLFIFLFSLAAKADTTTNFQLYYNKLLLLAGINEPALKITTDAKRQIISKGDTLKFYYRHCTMYDFTRNIIIRDENHIPVASFSAQGPVNIVCDTLISWLKSKNLNESSFEFFFFESPPLRDDVPQSSQVELAKIYEKIPPMIFTFTLAIKSE